MFLQTVYYVKLVLTELNICGRQLFYFIFLCKLIPKLNIAINISTIIGKHRITKVEQRLSNLYRYFQGWWFSLFFWYGKFHATERTKADNESWKYSANVKLNGIDIIAIISSTPFRHCMPPTKETAVWNIFFIYPLIAEFRPLALHHETRLKEIISVSLVLFHPKID